MKNEIPTLLRLTVAAASVVIPLILLGFGFYGSFSFTFSIPLFWQIAILGKGIGSLGLKRRSFWSSVLAGILAGILIAFFGGFILKSLGITGYSPDTVKGINNLLSSFHLNISFQGEVGYRLLSAGDGLKYSLFYLGYCVFMVGLGEEIFWRGFIQKKILRALPKCQSILITAVLFGLVHVYIFFIIPFKQGSFLLGLIILAGAIWGYLYEHFDNIWAPALSHGITAFIVWKYFVFSI